MVLMLVTKSLLSPRISVINSAHPNFKLKTNSERQKATFIIYEPTVNLLLKFVYTGAFQP